MKRSTTQAGRRDKRGTVLIFAVGALAVISIVAVSYVSVVRIERNSAAAVTRQNNLGDSIEIVANEIRAVLAADLFGNKIVTTTTPQAIGIGANRVRVWPKMFEDGEYSDYPSIDAIDPNLGTTSAQRFSHDLRFFGDPNSPPPVSVENDTWTLGEDRNIETLNRLSGSSIGRRFAVAQPDDAWLATTEPEYFSPLITDANALDVPWRNITNLRSAYRWVTREQGQNVNLWVRGDGRFVDLAEFFNTQQNRANLRLPLSTQYGDASRDINVIDPEYGSVQHNDLGVLAQALPGVLPQTRTSVYDRQMAYLGEQVEGTPRVRAGGLITRELVIPAAGDGEFNQIDERFWADTDGDLRPDARWQQIDALGNLGNLVWVVATRIIDASSLVNVNTAIAFDGLGNATPEQVIGSGRTPADVNLYELLLRASNTNSYYGLLGVDTTRFNRAFRQSHLDRGLGLTETVDGAPSVLREISEANFPLPVPLSVDLPYITTPGTDIGAVSSEIPSANLRSAHYEFVGISPHDNKIASDISYPVRDLYDLMAFWGTNNSSIITKLEQHMDGPEGNPFYPQSIEAYDMNGDLGPFGPLLSLENPGDRRVFDANAPFPQISHLRTGTRNALTTISGVGRYSPVPVLNDDPSFSNDFFRNKINLRDLARSRSANANAAAQRIADAQISADAQRIFESFVWALAPFATDQPYSSDLAQLSATNATSSSGAAFNELYGGPTSVTIAPGRNWHYGGGDGRPLHAQLFVDPADFNNGMTPPVLLTGDSGPAIALLTAASLTANLIDAVDGEDDMGAADGPTVIRIIPRVNKTAPNDITRAPIIEDRIETYPIELGMNLAQGEIIPFVDTTSIATFFGEQTPDSNLNVFTNPQQIDRMTLETQINTFGITVVGVERQPFLTDAFSVALYSDSRTIDTGLGLPGGQDGIVQPATEALGSFFAVKLLNPWAGAITVDPTFEVVIPGDPQGTGPHFEPLGVAGAVLTDLRFSLPAATIPSGGSAVFYWVYSDVVGIPWTDGPGGDADQGIRQALIDALTNDSIASEATTQVLQFANGPDPILATGTGITNVMFTVLPGLSTINSSYPVLLMRRLPDANRIFAGVSIGNGMPGQDTNWLLIDRLQTTTDFPAVLEDDVLLYPAAYTSAVEAEFGFFPSNVSENRGVTGRLMVTSSISRRKVNNPTGGWPSSIVEDIATNSGLSNVFSPEVAADLIDFGHFWLEPGGVLGDPTGADHPGLSPVNFLFRDKNAALASTFLTVDSAMAVNRTHRMNLGAFEGPDVNFPPIQFHCPNKPLDFVGQIGQISTLAHTCVGNRLLSLDHWSTFSEKLGLVLHRDVGGPPDPYAGVLDPTRYIFGGTTGVPSENSLNSITPPNTGPGSNLTVPENLTVPLATRVYDCFEALSPITDLKQGTINVNTASARTLELLPFIKPTQAYTTSSGSILQDGTSANSLRANMIVEYRDRIFSLDGATGVSPSLDRNFLLTETGRVARPLEMIPAQTDPDGATGLGQGIRQSNRRGAGGISTIGELAIIDQWAPAIGRPVLGRNGFGQLGTDSLNSNSTQTANFLDLSPAALGFDPRDDAEEAGRIFSAISNIATTRSDIFIAWTLIRGYDPDAIERIEEPDREQALLELDPVYNQRYLLVFDRSGITLPTDRPELLLRFRLPDLN